MDSHQAGGGAQLGLVEDVSAAEGNLVLQGSESKALREVFLFSMWHESLRQSLLL